MIAGQKAKVVCPYCTLSYYPGNIERHTKACLREIERRKRRQK